MSSLAITSENHVEPSSEDSCHESTISRPRYVVLQYLVGIMLAYHMCSVFSGLHLYGLSVVVWSGVDRKPSNDRGHRCGIGRDGPLPVVCATLDLTGLVVQWDRDWDRYGSCDRDNLSFG